MIQLGDGIKGLNSLSPGSVDLLIADMPSGETHAPFDKPLNLWAFWPAVWQSLKPYGTAVLFASSLRFASELIESQSKFYRYDLVWHKSLATGHLNSKKRPLRAHEFLLIFSRVVGIYNPQMVGGAAPIHAARRTGHGQNYRQQTRPNDSRAGATDRYPTSVLEFSSVGTSDKKRTHPQQKPEDLLRWIVRTFSSAGDLICDPCAGSGSTEIAAIAEKRRFVGWDIAPKFGKKAA